MCSCVRMLPVHACVSLEEGESVMCECCKGGEVNTDTSPHVKGEPDRTIEPRQQAVHSKRNVTDEDGREKRQR